MFLDCVCKDFTDKYSNGNCQKRSDVLGGLYFCYVNQTSYCPDALDSVGSKGEKFSSKPCKEMNTGTTLS